ncbi:hypothetical protein Tco_0836892 [Tanacetum coccineum]
MEDMFLLEGTPKEGKSQKKGAKASDNAGQARKETEPVKDYILLPLWTADPPFSKIPRALMMMDLNLQVMMEKLVIRENRHKVLVRKRIEGIEDAEGVDLLPNSTIFEQLTLMGYEKISQKLTFYKAFFSPQWKFLIHTILQCLSSKTTAWNEFSSTMASAIICLATNQKFNFSKYIFESMVKNLDNVGKFLMYPRFIQVFLDKQLEGMPTHNRIYIAPSHTKKIFGNMRRVGKGFSGRETPLFQTMVVQDQAEMGEGSANPTDPLTSQPQKKNKTIGKAKEERQSHTSGRINAIDADEDITLVNDQDDTDMFDVNTLTGDEVLAEQEVATKDVNLTVDEVTLAQALAALKSVKSKVKGDVIEEPSVPVSAASTKVSVATTTTTAIITTLRKGIVITELEPEKPLKKKDQISFDDQEAIRLHAKFDKEERLAREKDEANVALTEELDDIQAKVDADYKLAQRLQAKEQEQLTTEQKATLFQELLELRRKHFAAKRVEEKRNKPPIKTQQKNTMITYLKNTEGWKHKDLKSKDFDSIKKIFKESRRRARTRGTKKQKVDDVQETAKVDDDQEATKIKELMKIVPDEEEVVIDAIPLATKPPTIINRGLRFDSIGRFKDNVRTHIEDRVWRNQQDYRVLDWKLYDSYGVHSLRMQHMHIHMLVEKRYPLTPATITDMLNKKLQFNAAEGVNAASEEVKVTTVSIKVTTASTKVTTASTKLMLLKELMLLVKKLVTIES